MDLKIVKWFQSLQSPFLDYFFLFITEFGDELVFFVISAILYWTINKKFAYRFMMFFLASVTLNAVFKHLIIRDRPYVAHPDEVISIGNPTHGYAMPSGHAQNGMTTALLLRERFGNLKKWVTPSLFVMAVLVSISRIYLGQHYLTDVIVGMLVAALIYIGLAYLVAQLKLSFKHLLYVMVPVLVLLMIFIKDDNLYVSAAALIGLTIGYHLEVKYIDYNIKNVWPIQILKVVIGLGVAILLKEGLKLVLPYPEGEAITQLSLILDFIRYFLITMWLTLGSMILYSKIFKTPSIT
ncbi:MAG: phosphatase PAP2 family protein [Acholeplasmataceae bacterium]